MKNTLLLIAIVLASCGPDEFTPNFERENTFGYKPIYADSSDLLIRVESAQPIVTAGKIYSYGQLLIVNEVGKGIHIYNNVDPKNPLNLYFVSIPGNHDVAIKDGILYADSYADLVALEINSDTVIERKRLQKIITFSEEFPFQNNAYFECLDESKGKVVGWEPTTLDKPQCYRP